MSVYRIKRFSYDLLEGSGEYINAQLDTIHDVSSKLEDKLDLDKETRPAKLIRLAKDLSYLLKKKRKRKKNNSK